MTKLRISVNARHSHLEHFFELLDKLCEDFSKEKGDDVKLVFEEIFVNIVDYAYRGDQSKKMKIQFRKEADTLAITFFDKGKEFNPLLRENPDLEHIETPGGFGIFFIKELADNASYERRKNQNILTVFFVNKN